MEISKDDLYVENGLIYESSTNAILVAMGTKYNVNEYYNVTLSNGFTHLVKVVDVKSDLHTDVTNCYTTADDSIVELATYGHFKYEYLGNSNIIDIYVTEIKEG